MTHQPPNTVRRRHTLGDYGEKPVRRYKLAEDLSAGSSAEAYWVAWDAEKESYEPFDGTNETYSQSFTLYSGPNSATGSKDDFGYAAYFADRQQWEPIGGGGSPLAIATLTAELSSGASAAFTFVGGGTGTGTCYDALLCGGDSLASGAKVVIGKIAGKWYVLQAVCPCS